MLIAAIILFALAALVGLTLAVKILGKKETSKPVALAHGLVGAIGLVFLILYSVKNPHHFLTAAIVLLVVAALGGVVLFANDLRKKPGPAALVVVHALAAVAAVVLILIVATR
jgi:FtsH-binding integral membrane protein